MFVRRRRWRAVSARVSEIDHVAPRALGGSGEAENLRVYCRPHNRDAAERVFGRGYVEARIQSTRKRSSQRPDLDEAYTRPGNFSQRKCAGARSADDASAGTATASPSVSATLLSSRATSRASETRGEGVRRVVGTAFPSSVGGLALAARSVAPTQTQDGDARKHVRTALLTLGFRGAETDRALFAIDRKECDEPWCRPIETLVREAIGLLT